MPADVLNGNHKYYDRDKYAELVLDVAETVLGTFGFKRKHLGVRPRAKSYLDELQFERSKERLVEIESLMDVEVELNGEKLTMNLDRMDESNINMTADDMMVLLPVVNFKETNSSGAPK